MKFRLGFTPSQPRRRSLNQLQAWRTSVQDAREVARGGVFTAAEFLSLLGRRSAWRVFAPPCVYRRRRARDDRAYAELDARIAVLPPPRPPEGRVWIFSNGTEYDYWTGINCDRCALAGDPSVAGSSPCQIFEAIHDAAIDDGTVPIEIAERMGEGARCPEWQGVPIAALRGAGEATEGV